MPHFLAMTSKGLEEALAQELEALEVKVLKKQAYGVLFESHWKACYRANLCLRSATRILQPCLDFPAYQPEDLYHNVMAKHDFAKDFNLDKTFAIYSSVRDSSFKDQRFVSLKIKDAIADQFRNKFTERPNVDSQNPDVRIYVRVLKNQVSVALDTSGESLSHRGYRRVAVEAPLREHVAAGILHYIQWDEKQPLVDLMCGSGTFLIEAALQASHTAPGSLRKGFGFQNLNNFQEPAWSEVLELALDKEKEPPTQPQIFGFDIQSQAVQAARTNARAAGVDEWIGFQRRAVDQVEPPTAEPGVIVVNPPYGARLGDVETVKDIYRDLSFTLKQKFKGWTCWLLSGNHELTQLLKLKATQKIPIYNGPIECRLLKYEIR